MIIVCDPRCGLDCYPGTYEFTPIVGGNALMYAVSAGRADIVELLLALGAKLNHAGYNALSFAVRTGNLPMVRLLIAHGADVVSPDIMHIAVLGHRVEVVRELSLYGAPVDKKGENNWQGGEPLHFVAKFIDWTSNVSSKAQTFGDDAVQERSGQAL